MDLKSNTTATHSINDEHQLLRKSILQFRLTLAAGVAPRQHVETLLEEIVQQVLAHFEHEETGGYFVEALEAAPRLSERAEALLKEHPQMVEQILALRQLATSSRSGTNWWQPLENEFAAFWNRFTAHEEAENVLLQEAYHDDIGAED